MNNITEHMKSIVSAAFEVHCQMGHGFITHIYREALTVEFKERGIPFDIHVPTPLFYKGHELTGKFRVDFICHSTILVEVCCMPDIATAAESLMINCLRASGLKQGILLNFGAAKFQHRHSLYTLPEEKDQIRVLEEYSRSVLSQVECRRHRSTLLAMETLECI